jgi:drug/metabolite transporter (DMT)-like permease
MGITSQDSFAKALAYLMFGVTAGLGLDLCAKWLLADYSLEQFVFLRSVLGLLVFLSISRWYGGVSSLKTRRWKWHLLRTVLASIAMFGFFFGLSRMPLVETLTLAFTAPLIVTALSVPLLGEHVGWRRWTAVLFGFAGVLIVLRPGSGLLTPASFAVLAAAVAYAGLAISSRKLAATETTLSMTVYVISGPLLISAFFVPGNYTNPTASGWFFFVLAGICSAAAWVGLVGGYRRASPAILAPFEYTALIGAAVAGYWIWGEVPDRWVILGGLVIISSGLFVVYREVGDVLSARYLRGFSSGGAAAIVRRLRRKNEESD